MKRCVLIFLAVVFFVQTGCSVYDRPAIIHSVEKVDFVSYKKLSRDDFRATRPPEGITKVSVAAVCTNIVLAPDVLVETKPVQTGDGSRKYEATLRNLGFRAVANRECSWWNSSMAWTRDPEEVLEHEQVHFAIREVAARGLNRRAAELARTLRTVAETPAQAIAKLNGNSLSWVLQESLKRDARFDRETVEFGGRAEQRWLAQLESELQATEVFAR